MINNKSFNKDEFLANLERLDDDKKKLLLKIYKKYKFYNEIFKDKKQMKEAENKIYTINGKPLNDYKKIEIEVNRINNQINKKDMDQILMNNDFYKVYSEIRDTILYLQEHNDPVVMHKLKKDISYLQVVLGLNTNFFDETYELFEDNYKSLMIDDIENKKVR